MSEPNKKPGGERRGSVRFRLAEQSGSNSASDLRDPTDSLVTGVDAQLDTRSHHLTIRLLRRALLAEDAHEIAECLADWVELVAQAQQGTLLLAGSEGNFTLFLPGGRERDLRLVSGRGQLGRVLQTREPLIREGASSGASLMEGEELIPLEDGHHQLVQAVRSVGSGEGMPDVLALVVATRRQGESPFDHEDVRRVDHYLRGALPAIERAVILRRTEAVLSELEAPRSEHGEVLFRDRAVEADRSARHRMFGEPLRLLPEWLGWLQLVLIVSVLAGGAFLLVARSAPSVSGLATVSLASRSAVAALESGLVEEVHVAPGQEVQVGEPLLTLESATAAAQLSLLHERRRRALLGLLLDPVSDSSAQQLREVGREMKWAQAALDVRTQRAPRSGTVQHVRVRSGMLLERGETALVLADDATIGGRVFAAVDAAQRQKVLDAVSFWLVVERERSLRLPIQLTWVADSAAAPDETLKFLGQSARSQAGITGSKILLEARWSAADLEELELDDALVPGEVLGVEIVLPAEPLWRQLLPGTSR